jgi:hypothetical protein
MAEATRDFLALPNQPPGNGHKIIDWERLRASKPRFMGIKRAVEMAQLWDGEISYRTI